MARRKQRQLGYSPEKHREFADYTNFDYVLEQANKALDANDCPGAFKRFRGLVEEETARSIHLYAANETGEKLPVADHKKIVDMDKAVSDLASEFSFRCLVGGFAGLKRRRKN